MNDLARSDPTLPQPSRPKCNPSMQLTRAADYAVRAMVHLATLPDEKRTLLPDLSAVIGAPESFCPRFCRPLHARISSPHDAARPADLQSSPAAAERACAK